MEVVQLNPLVGLLIIVTVCVLSLFMGFVVGHSQGLIKGVSAGEKVVEQFNQNETLQTLAHGATQNVPPELFTQALNIIAFGRNAAQFLGAPDEVKELLKEVRDMVYNIKDPVTPPPPDDEVGKTPVG